MNTPERGPHPGKRWQGWTGVLLGSALMTTVVQTAPGTGARNIVLVFGSLLAVSGVYSLVVRQHRSEYAHMVLGFLLFVSPWVLGFAGQSTALPCWILGAGAVLLGLASLPPAEEPAAHSQQSQRPLRVCELTEVRASGGRHHLPDPSTDAGEAVTSSTQPALSGQSSTE